MPLPGPGSTPSTKSSTSAPATTACKETRDAAGSEGSIGAPKDEYCGSQMGMKSPPHPIVTSMVVVVCARQNSRYIALAEGQLSSRRCFVEIRNEVNEIDPTSLIMCSQDPNR